MKYNTYCNTIASIGIGYIVILLALAGGWVANVVKIVSALADPITGMLIARLVGTIVFPLGGVLGYF